MVNRRLEITVGDCWAEAKGHGSRGLLMLLTGRPPVFNIRTRSWCTTPQRVRDLVALAEIRGFDVHVTTPGGEAWEQ